VFLNSEENIQLENNLTKTDTFGDYYSQCDFDGDGIDDLFLATGKTWWFSSSGVFHWTFLNTSSIRKKDLKFGYFDDDNRCDIISESGGSDRWLISSGGTAGWKPLEDVWPGSPPMDGPWRPLKEIEFGRFDPNDLSHGRQTTHAFWREPNTGKWFVKKLSDPGSMWEHVGRSDRPLNELRFGDFTGDGVTDVLGINEGTWAISESARKKWRPLNTLNDPINKDLFIANIDLDDNIDDVLRLEVQSGPAGPQGQVVTLIWRRSKNGAQPWTGFKRHTFTYNPSFVEEIPVVYPKRGFVGRFSGEAENAGTMVIDEKRIGHFFSLGHREWRSRFPY
jgi:hypothetical protein